MLDRILAVAENGWVELVHRRALYILAAAVVLCFLGPVFAQYRWFIAVGTAAKSQHALAESMFSWDQFFLFVGLCAAILFAAGSIDAEVSRRTLCSVMIRPIHRWEYAAGRAISVLLFYLTFVLAALFCSYGAAHVFGVALPVTFLLGLLQRLCRGAAWIVIALSLGSITSSASAVTLIAMTALLSMGSSYLSNDIHWTVPLFKQALHYATPCAWETDFLNFTTAGAHYQFLGTTALIGLENLMYGVAVFVACSWIFTRRDLKLRE